MLALVEKTARVFADEEEREQSPAAETGQDADEPRFQEESSPKSISGEAQDAGVLV
jgi:hypothetical protein